MCIFLERFLRIHLFLWKILLVKGLEIRKHLFWRASSNLGFRYLERLIRYDFNALQNLLGVLDLPWGWELSVPVE